MYGNEAEDIVFEHFSWSFWDVTKEHFLYKGVADDGSKEME